MKNSFGRWLPALIIVVLAAAGYYAWKALSAPGVDCH